MERALIIFEAVSGDHPICHEVCYSCFQAGRLASTPSPLLRSARRVPGTSRPGRSPIFLSGSPQPLRWGRATEQRDELANRHVPPKRRFPLAEIRLRGWGERTRTCKCQFEEVVGISREFSLDLWNMLGPETDSCLSCFERGRVPSSRQVTPKAADQSSCLHEAWRRQPWTGLGRFCRYRETRQRAP